MIQTFRRASAEQPWDGETGHTLNSTKQLGLSKDIQQDAQEMVRRAEYALGKAIRAGQERGEIRRPHETARRPVRLADDVLEPNIIKASPTEFGSSNRQEVTETYAMADASLDQFEEALTDARDEGNLSRANVVRKVQGVKSDKLAPAGRLNAERVRLGTLPNVRQASIPVTTQLAGRWTRRSVRGMHWTPRSGNRRV